MPSHGGAAPGAQRAPEPTTAGGGGRRTGLLPRRASLQEIALNLDDLDELLCFEVVNSLTGPFGSTQHQDVDSEYIPDISAKCPLFVSGRYQGKLPETLTAKGYLADMSEISIELKIQHIKDIPLDKVLAKQQMDLLTAKAWLSENKQLEKKVPGYMIWRWIRLFVPKDAVAAL